MSLKVHLNTKLGEPLIRQLERNLLEKEIEEKLQEDNQRKGIDQLVCL